MFKGGSAGFLILLSLSALYLFTSLGELALIDPDEPRYAEGAREMRLLRDYIVPHLNFTPRINKPALFYWLVALSYQLFGISEFSARLPSAFFSFILLFLIYFWVKAELGQRTALLSSLVLLSSPLFLIISRLCIIDPLFFCLLGFTLFTFWKYLKEGIPPLFPFLFLGLAFFAKGPIALVLILLTLFTFSLWERSFLHFKKAFNPWGILIFLLVGCSWYLVLLYRIGYPAFKELLFQETIARFKEGVSHTGPFWYYLPILFVGFLPWSIYLIMNFKELRFRVSFLRYISSFSLATFLFFSICKTKLPTYILPILFPLSVYVGVILDKKFEEVRRIEVGIIFALIIIFSAYILIRPNDLLKFLSYGEILKAIFYTLLVSLPLLLLMNCKLRVQITYLFLFFPLLYFIFIYRFGEGFSSYRSCKELFEDVKVRGPYHIYSLRIAKPSLVFYSRKKIERMDDLNTFKGGYLVLKKEDLSRLLDITSSFEILSETKKYYLVWISRNS